MPQGGPPGAGGPMPGPQAPGGAGGPMPGMPQGPQGPGAPMAYGGMIPGYQEGSLVDDYIDERDSFGIGDALMYPINHPIKSASALALAKMFGPKNADLHAVSFFVVFGSANAWSFWRRNTTACSFFLNFFE